MTSRIPVLTAAETRDRLSYRGAVDALEAALRAGAEPASDPPRTSAPLGRGDVLFMASTVDDALGVKVITVTPDNPSRGLPRIQGLHIVFDPATMAPTAVLDGATLTAVRTPAVSLVGIRPALALRPGPLRVVVFGVGPQGTGHVRALQEVVAADRPIEAVTYVATKDPSRPLVPPDADVLLAHDRGPIADRLARADLVVCATTARQPLFDSRVLPDHAAVVAVGSHEPDARELDAALMGRAQVIVEDVATARREAGDVVQAVNEGTLDATRLITLKDSVDGTTTLSPDTPVVFKSSGMSWEDAVVARTALGTPRPHPSTQPTRRRL